MNRIDVKQLQVALYLVYVRPREGVSAPSSKESRTAELAKRRSCCTIPRPSTSTSEQLGVRGGPLCHRLGRRAGEFGDQVVGVLRMIDGLRDLVEVPRRLPTQRAVVSLFGFGPFALLIADRHADSSADLFGDLRASDSFGPGD